MTKTARVLNEHIWRASQKDSRDVRVTWRPEHPFSCVVFCRPRSPLETDKDARTIVPQPPFPLTFPLCPSASQRGAAVSNDSGGSAAQGESRGEKPEQTGASQVRPARAHRGYVKTPDRFSFARQRLSLCTVTHGNGWDRWRLQGQRLLARFNSPRKAPSACARVFVRSARFRRQSCFFMCTVVLLSAIFHSACARYAPL